MALFQAVTGLKIDKATILIPAGNTVIADTVALADFHALKYFLVMFNDGNSINKSLELNVVKIASSVRETVSNKVGTSADLEVNGTINGTDFELELVNNEAFDLTVEFAKIKLD